MINEIQKLNLQLMRLASFNEFDGNRVVDDLERHENLWTSAWMTRWDLIPLLDQEGDIDPSDPDGPFSSPPYWNVDSLYILPAPGKEDALTKMARKWRADEVAWLGGEVGCKALGSWSRERATNKRLILKVWWD